MTQVDDAGGGSAPRDAEFDEIYDSPQFAELRSRFRLLVFPLVAAFLAWYGLYVVCAVYARDFMAEELVGHINVALVFGLLQFASTFGIAFFYAKRAENQIDARARVLRSQFEGGAK